MIRLLALLSLLIAAPALGQPASEAYPTRPIRMIVPFAAGGSADLVARIAAQGMSEKLGQTIAVEIVAAAAVSLVRKPCWRRRQMAIPSRFIPCPRPC